MGEERMAEVPPGVPSAGLQRSDKSEYVIVAVLFGWLTAALDFGLLDFAWRGYLRAVRGNWGYVAIRTNEKSALIATALLIGLVLFGALFGALSAHQGASAAQRWCRAAIGAFTVHLVLPVILVIAVIVSPPKIVIPW